MAAATKLICDQQHFEITVKRLCYQLIENHQDFSSTVLIGIQPRGVLLSRRIQKQLQVMLEKSIVHGELDISFFRDDFRRKDIVPSATNIDFVVENKKVILVDDVLYTGRTIRSGLDALLAFGRPEKVELLVLVNRKFSRQFPIEADYIGVSIDAFSSDKVTVEWKEAGGKDSIWLTKQNTDE
jgi:pyrimidine operon attenuation protein / uracil phosphoribosyltransferase